MKGIFRWVRQMLDTISDTNLLMQVRIYGMTYFNDTAPYWGDQSHKIFDNNRLTARSVKFFADGALRSGGAAVCYKDCFHWHYHTQVPSFLAAL